MIVTRVGKEGEQILHIVNLLPVQKTLSSQGYIRNAGGGQRRVDIGEIFVLLYENGKVTIMDGALVGAFSFDGQLFADALGNPLCHRLRFQALSFTALQFFARLSERSQQSN